ncbi:phage Tail Collar domain protein [Burkholderia cenocepacia]|uniref:Phage Tail Collar domain protein n=1 Tax=Burkholderia cenocepacia TaxID=95486 RepID=A0AAN0RQ10_9BURK|nr:phage Tail Collar domain protein [Burkholderia cenocepacia]
MDYPKSVPGVGLVDGKFVDEDPIGGRAGSLIPAAWGNSITDEMLTVLRAANIDPDEASTEQLLAAIRIVASKGSTRPPGDDSEYWATTEFVAAAIRSMMPDRVGEIAFEMRILPRVGWLRVNGAVLKRDAYPELWAYAQASGALVSERDWSNGWFGCFSSGDEATTFRIPDLRGDFLRIWDDGRGVDRGRRLGAWQDSTNRWHEHTGTASEAGDHIHTGWTDVRGHHWHDLYDPGHKHRNGFGSVGVFGTSPGEGYGPHNGRRNEVDSDVSYSGISLGAAGDHDHIVGIGAAGRHGHLISIAGEGASEARPRNIAVAAYIRAYRIDVKRGK